MYSAAPVRAPAAPGSRLLPLLVRRGGDALLPWLVVGAAVWPLLPLGRRSGGAFSYPLSRLPFSDGAEGKTPMGLVAVDNKLFASPLLLNPRRRKDEAKSLGCPGLDRPGARGSAACSLYATVDTGGKARGRRGFSFPGPGSIRARARPAPQRACRLSGPAAPRAARAGAAGPAAHGAAR
jgi:hypothetical protein